MVTGYSILIISLFNSIGFSTMVSSFDNYETSNILRLNP